MKNGGDFPNHFVNETSLYNAIVLGNLLPAGVLEQVPHVLQTWMRNFIGGAMVYLVFSLLLSIYIYYVKQGRYVPRDEVPTKRVMLLQICLAMQGMPWFSALPTLSEFMVESGWTRCFPRISDAGWPAYLLYTVMYLVLTEFGVYWTHRAMHDIRFLYKNFHSVHHRYNDSRVLSPFAALAFHPIDGIFTASPHVLVLLILPTHFTTHLGLLFLEAVWSVLIHDTVSLKGWLLLDAGYHTIHHSRHRHNYGQYTVGVDWIFGTLRHPAKKRAA